MPDFDKTIEMSLTLNVDGAEKKAKTLREDIEKGKIELKTDLDISGLVDQIRIVESAIKRVSKSFKDETSNIGRSMRGLEFSSFEESILNIEDAVRGLDLQFRKMFKGDVNLDVFKSLNNILKEINKNVGLISKKLQMNPIRTVDAVEAELDQVNQKIKQVKNNAGELEKLRKQLTNNSVKNIAKNIFSGDDIDSKEIDKLIAKVEKYQKLGGDISSISFSIRHEDLTTGKNINDTVSLISLLEDLSDLYEKVEKDGKQIRTDAQDIKLGEIVDISKDIKNIDELEKKVIELNSELERAKNADEPFGIRKSDIDTISKSFLNLQEVLEHIRNLLINADFENIGKSLGDATIGFKPEDVEKITQAFTEFKDVVIEIKKILETFDIPKIKPDGDTAIRNWISDLEKAGEVANRTDKAIEEAFRVSNAQDGGSAVDLLASSLREAEEQAEKTVLSFDKVAEAVRKVSEEFVNSRRYSLGARDLSLDDVTWDGGTYSPKKNRPDSGLVRGIREDDLFSNIRNQYSLYTKMQTAFKKGNINESELQDAANEFKNVVVSNFVAAFRRNTDKSLLYDVQNSLPKKIFPVIEEYIRDAQTFIHEYNEFAEKFRQLKDSNGLNSQVKLIELGKGINTRENQISEDSLFAEAVPKFEDASDDLTRYLATNYSNLSDFEATLKDVCKILGVEIPKTTERASEAIREVGNENNLLSDKTPDLFEYSTGQLSFIQDLTQAEKKLGDAAEETAEKVRKANDQIEGQMSFTDLMHTVDGTFIKDTHQGEYKPQEALLGIQKTNEALQETQQQARLTATELERINTAFQKDTHTTNEDSLIPRETVSVAREVNNTLEQTEDITKRIPGNIEETALALRETGQQARSAAEEIEQAFRADIDQKSKDNMIPTETLPAVREINDAFEQTGEIGTTALVRIDSEAENTIGIFKRLADVVENIFRIASTSDNIIDLDESQYRPTDTADSVHGLIEEKAKMDDVGASASKTAKKKREFAEANQSVLASIKESLKGLSDETEAFNTLNSLIKTMGKNSEMDNTIKGLKAIGDLLSSPLDDNSMVSAIKELAAQGDVLKDVANVLKNASKQKLANAKETQETKNQNKLYNESIRLLEQIDKLKLKNLSLSPTSDAYIKNEHDIRKKENQYNDNLDKLDLQKRADLTAELRQKNDQYNDSLAETARTMAEVNAKSLEESLKKLNAANITSLDDRIKKMITDLKAVDSAVGFNNIKASLSDLVSDVNKKLAYIKETSDKLFKSDDIAKWADKLQKEIIESAKTMPELKEKAQDVLNKLEEFSKTNLDLSTEEAQKELNDLKRKFDDVFSKKQLDEFKVAHETTITNLNKKIAQFVKQNSAMGREFQERFDNLKLDWDTTHSREELKKLAAEFNKLEQEVIEAGKTGASFFDTLRQRAMGVNAQLIARYLSWQDMIRYARRTAEAVISVDSALAELRKVSGESTDRLQESFRVSTETAKELGSTISDVISVTADWSRVGYSISDAEELARITTLFQTVGDNMTAETASQAMISTIKAYGMQVDEVESIVDKYNEVARISWQNNIVIYYWVDNYIG